ncbi:MAG: phage major capsid protein [Deltaproteobacteria bacterium]|nr:phage major capsid protein [Deltaproteobacteria bacterium]MBW2151783.1 phage major capsid protein [Deltaproteobacteria bacterium]
MSKQKYEEYKKLRAKLRPLRDQRAAIVERQKEIIDKAARNKRDLTSGENAEFEELDNQFDEVTNEIDELMEEIEPICKELREQIDDFYSNGSDTEQGLTRSQRLAHLGIGSGEIEYRGNLNCIKSNRQGVMNMKKRMFQNSTYRFDEKGTELRDAFNKYLRYGQGAISPREFRALQADSMTAGGYLVTPVEVAQEIIKALDDEVFIRRFARTFDVPNAESLGTPALEHDLGDPTWTSELGTGSEDSTMDFTRRDLTPHPIARRIKVSNKLLRVASGLNPEELIAERMVYKIGIVQENAFLNGSGVNQPLGIFTASDNGIDTSRDVSAGNTTTNVTADGLINAVGALKAQYRRNARWVFHRDLEARVRKLKDGEGQYLWRTGLEGSGNTLLGFPIHLSEYCPHTFSTGQYVAVLGDFRFFWIVDSLQFQIQRLIELYSEQNQTGFICRAECDAMPVLAEAFVRVKLS